MGWRGTTTTDVVLLALTTEPLSVGEIVEKIDYAEWSAASEYDKPIGLCAQNVTTRLRRLLKRDLAAPTDDGLAWVALAPGEAERKREERFQAVQPSDDDRALAAELAEAAEVRIHLEVVRNDKRRGQRGGHVGVVIIETNRGAHRSAFNPASSSWERELRRLLVVEEEVA